RRCSRARPDSIRAPGRGHRAPNSMLVGCIMAIVSASNIGVHVGGRGLFEGVSFKLEPGDRMTLSGRNGAGKTTLLRMLARESAPDAGTLSYQRSARIALHDQRPPRDSGLTLGGYVFSGRAEMVELEEELARLESEMSAGRHDD